MAAKPGNLWTFHIGADFESKLQNGDGPNRSQFQNSNLPAAHGPTHWAQGPHPRKVDPKSDMAQI